MVRRFALPALTVTILIGAVPLAGRQYRTWQRITR